MSTCAMSCSLTHCASAAGSAKSGSLTHDNKHGRLHLVKPLLNRVHAGLWWRETPCRDRRVQARATSARCSPKSAGRSPRYRLGRYASGRPRRRTPHEQPKQHDQQRVIGAYDERPASRHRRLRSGCSAAARADTAPIELPTMTAGPRGERPARAVPVVGDVVVALERRVAVPMTARAVVARGSRRRPAQAPRSGSCASSPIPGGQTTADDASPRRRSGPGGGR